jgi:hypothetical protein
MRPEFVTQEDIDRWSEALDKETLVPKFLTQAPLVREVFYAGYWLGEKLLAAGCSEELAVRIGYLGGQLSFGKNPWQVHQELWDDYINNRMEFETDYDA